MAINSSIDARARLVRLIYVGEDDVSDLAATMQAIFRSPDYRPGFGFAINRKAVDPPAYDYVDRLLAFAVLHRERLEGCRFALVVEMPDVYGWARMAQTLAPASPVRVQAFQQSRDAERWLRLTAPNE